MSRCPTSDVSRLRCAVPLLTYTRIDPSVRDLAWQTLGQGTHTLALWNGAPSSGSSIRGRWTASYAQTRRRWYARLAAAGVAVTRRQEGRRVVLCLGPAYAPCLSPGRHRATDPGNSPNAGGRVNAWLGYRVGTDCYGNGYGNGYPAARLSCEHETLHRATDPTDLALYRRECSGAPHAWPVVRLLRFA